nr:PREDICTED: protein Daple [Latimeria chalumnae]|eukprot:XP_014341817.1 PREDICTED: protein Daple [Latimeria chalumnae]
MEEMKKLLLLMLGCAVQCDRKEELIEKIKQLDIETQASIVTHIQEVTHNQENVLDLQWLELPDIAPEDLDSLSRSMAFNLRRLIDERDDCSELIVELTQERDYLQSQQPLSPIKTSSPESPSSPSESLSQEDKQHLAVELADTKAKLRRIKQELEEKTEQLIDAKHEVDRSEMELQKLKHENLQLTADARSARAYRDELDSLRDRASRVEKLEMELTRCREKLHDVDFYKNRMEELREDNMVLIETKTMFEEQLKGARIRCDKLHELEKENLQLKSKLHDLEIDRDTDKKRIEELIEENMVLEIAQKQSMNESVHLGWELEQLSKSADILDARKSFVFELNESASSKVLKLEKENQSLQNTIQELRDVSLTMEEGSYRIQELEKENRKLSEKTEKLHTQLEQEKQSTQDLETLSEELLKEKEQLKETLETIRAERERQVKELEQENEHLNQAIVSLRQRCQISKDARVKDIERENKILHETITETSNKLNKLEFEKKQVQKELCQAKEKAEKIEELEKEVPKLERENEQLQKTIASMKIICEKVGALEEENSNLEVENRKLQKSLGTLQNGYIRLETVEKDNKQLEEENLGLRKTVENLKSRSTKLAQTELEKKDLEKENEELKRNVEMLKTLSKKSERLELSYQGLDSENQRLQQDLENTNKKIQQFERELQEAEKERQALQKTLEEVRVSSKRAEDLERQNRLLEQEMSQIEKDNKKLEKEAKRLRHQVEVKETVLEERGQKLSALEKENKTLEKETCKLRESSDKTKDLEKDNKELVQQATIDKKTLATLREDLVHEKLKSQQMSNELEKLSLELEKLGLSKEKLLQDVHSNDEIKYKILENKIESTLKKTLEIKEEKIVCLESQLEESLKQNQQLYLELSMEREKSEATKPYREEICVQNSVKNLSEKMHLHHQVTEKWETKHRGATMEQPNMKDRVIEVERSNAALHAEKQLLKEQLRKLEDQNSTLTDQIMALQKQATSLHDHTTALQTQKAKLQVENSTLSSQKTFHQKQQSVLENNLEAVQKQKEELKATHEHLAQDHERLVALHERQSTEYEALISQHRSLKTSHRNLELEHKTLEQKFGSLMNRKAEWEELEKRLQLEQNCTQQERKKKTIVVEENQRLKEDLDRVNVLNSHLKQDCEALQTHTKELKSSLNGVQLELSHWQARYDELKEQHQNLDISLTKSDNRYELLTRLKANLEEENHHLLSQIQMVTQQNQTLMEQSMESKEHFHEEQKQYIDKLNSLRRQKEKLEEKIMDQYKFYDPAPKKKNHWVGAKALVKLMKPKKEGSRERLKSATEGQLQQSEPTEQAAASAPSSPLPLQPQRESFEFSLQGSNSTEENHTGSSGKAITDLGHRPRELSRSTSSNENVDSPDNPRHQRMDLGAVAYSTSAIHLATSNSTPTQRPHNRSRGFNSDDDLQVPPHEADFSNGGYKNQAFRTSSLDNSRNTSNSSSPLNSKGSMDRIPGKTESLSSDDLVPSRETATLPRDSYLYRSSSAVLANSPSKQELSLSRGGLMSHDTPQKSGPNPSRSQSKINPASPGNEMVTLEEFLQESNRLSPPIRRHSLNENELISLHQFLSEAESLYPSVHTPPSLQHEEPLQSIDSVVKSQSNDVGSRQETVRANRRTTSLYIPRENSNSNEDLLSDYFRKVTEPPVIGNQPTMFNRKENAKMPTSYVTPNMKPTLESVDGRSSKQYVKPNPRPMEISGQPCSLRPTVAQQSRTLSGTRQTTQLQQPGAIGNRSGSLNRAYSLASADLLRANGPDSFRQELFPKPGMDTSVGKDVGNSSWRLSAPSGSQVSLRERPQSARTANPSPSADRCRQVDPRRLSLAPPKEERAPAFQLYSAASPCSQSPTSDQTQDNYNTPSSQQHYSATQHAASRVKVRPVSRCGEVAMVTPVRPTVNHPEEEGAKGHSSAETPISKIQSRSPETTAVGASEDLSRTSSSAPKSTPVSPESSGDQQTVWYEYGCV